MITYSLINKVAQTITETEIKVPKTSLQADTFQHGLQIFFGIAGAVAVLVVAVGAFQYSISRGDAGSIKKAKETILYAVIGLLVTMTGYGIVTYVFTNL